ncbi:fibronectin type III domain-containing protein [Sarocladium implicatum]|nr:fibronectin type III domain-containing protein [Sarocladium implicatum]
MVVGDSISHGADGDWTWRYHVWQWLKDQSYDVEFVGPYKGTKGPESLDSAKPRPPLLPNEADTSFPAISGTYTSGVPSAFISQGHASYWGRQAKQDENQIEGWVKQYQPDIILMLLGFNDLGWFVTGPQGLIYSMTKVVDGARRGKSDVQFAIGNVVERLFIGGRQDLVDNTRDYNEKLKDAVNTWNYNLVSRVAYVDVAGGYDCRPGGCPDGYDGLHPGAQGELHIAKSFADVLTNDGLFLLKGKDFRPGAPAARLITTPANFAMSATDYGLLMSWTRQTNARGYNIRLRIKGQTSWWSDGEVYPSINLSYFTWCLKGQVWEAQVAARGDRNELSGWSNILSATCNPKTSPGPNAIIVQPSGNDAISFSWAAVTGYTVDRYAAIIWDKDEPGAFISQYSTRGTSITIGGLIKGHKYGCWVQTWVKMTDGSLGGGLPAAAREVRTGMGAPPVVTGLKVVNKEPTTITLSWNASPSAGGYEILYRAIATPEKIEIVGTTTDTTYEVGFLFPGTWNYEFCVHSYNGNLQAACTSFIRPPKYPGYKRNMHDPRKPPKPAPLKLTGNNTDPRGFLVDHLTPKLWDKVISEADSSHVVTPSNVTSDE